MRSSRASATVVLSSPGERVITDGCIRGTEPPVAPVRREPAHRPHPGRGAARQALASVRVLVRQQRQRVQRRRGRRHRLDRADLLAGADRYRRRHPDRRPADRAARHPGAPARRAADDPAATSGRRLFCGIVAGNVVATSFPCAVGAYLAAPLPALGPFGAVGKVSGSWALVILAVSLIDANTFNAYSGTFQILAFGGMWR